MTIPASEQIPVFRSSESRSPLRGVRPRRFWRLLRGLFTLAFLLGLAVFLTLYVVVARQVHREGGGPGDAFTFLIDPAGYAFRGKSRLNILCLGVDYNHTSQGIRYSKNARSDTMILVSLDRKTGSVSVLSIPRDLRVYIGDGYGHDKINAAHAVGGPRLSRLVVERLLGLPIHYSVTVRVEAAREIIDAIGGLALDVEKDMDYDDNWGSLHIHLKKGRQRLNGSQVVGYCRFRHDEEGDLGRIRRQQQVLAALSRELKAQGSPEKAMKLVGILRRHTSTDLSTTRMLALGRAFSGMDRSKLKTARLAVADETIDGVAYLVPLEEQNRALVRRLLTSPEEVPLSDVRLEVLNGSGQDGAAGRTADRLERAGFHVVRVADADRSDYSRSRVVDRLGSQRARTSIRRVLPEAEFQSAPSSDEVDLTVIVGRS
ncbi:MAG: LCP family protein [Candidatus Eremiobacterota bacterium]